MHQSENKRFIFFSFFTFLIMIIVVFIIAKHDVMSMKSKATLFEKNTDELKKIQNTLISIQNVETGVSGYLLTGNEKFLNTYYLGKNNIVTDTIGLRNLNSNSTWKNNIDSLNRLIEKKLSHSENLITTRKEKGVKEASSLIGKDLGAKLTNGIRDQSNQLMNFQLNELNNQNRIWKYFTFTQSEGLIVFIAFTLLILVFNFYILQKGFSKIDAHNQQLKEKYTHKAKELNIVFERITEAFIALDNDWNYTYVNPKAALMYQLPVDQIVGKNIWEITPQIAHHPFRIKLLQAKEMMKPIKAELFHPETNQWFENWIYPDQHGISVYYREITDRKIVEQNILDTKRELEMLNERFMMVSKATNDPIWDWQIGSEFVWGNESYLKLVDQTSGEFVLLNTIESRIFPEDLKKISERYEEAIRAHKNNLAEEFRFQKNENEVLIFLNRVNIIYNERNEPYRIVGTLQDITNQRSIQQQILLEKELSDVLINSLPGVFYMFNKEGKYIRWNKNIEMVTGYSTQEMHDLHPIVFVPEDQREMLAKKIENVFNYGIDNAEADLLTKDNRRIPYYFTGMYIKYNGEDCMMGVGIDISDRIQYQQELLSLTAHLQDIREEERTNIAREIHDELGQQLTGIKMQLSQIKNKQKSDNPIVSAQLADTVLLIDNAIKAVRKIATELRPSILDDLGLISALEWQAEEFQKRYFIETKFDANQTEIHLPKDQATAIFRIYQESLTNILRHSNATLMNIKLRIEENNMQLVIEDNGIGFDKNVIQQKRTLGLLGMKERAAKMCGTLDIISNEGAGTKLTLSVPLET